MDYAHIMSFIDKTGLSREQQRAARAPQVEKIIIDETLKDLSDLHTRLSKIKALKLLPETKLSMTQLSHVCVEFKRMGLYKGSTTKTTRTGYLEVIEEILKKHFDPNTGEPFVPIDSVVRVEVKESRSKLTDSEVFRELSTKQHYKSGSGSDAKEIPTLLPQKRKRTQRIQLHPSSVRALVDDDEE
jgi:hypothetical protein